LRGEVVADDALVITDNRREIHRELVSAVPIQEFIRRATIEVAVGPNYTEVR
jgi:hypothetical protein